MLLFVIQLSKPGRLDSDLVPTLQNTADVMDFAFDPFNTHRLAVGELTSYFMFELQNVLYQE